MNNITALLLVTLISLSVFSQNKSRKLVILHTNDLHSNLTGFSPEREYTPLTINDDSTQAGFARIATIIKREKATSPDNLLVLDAGDLLMGSFFHPLEIKSGFQLPLMKKMGYDVVCIGNHEFDFGPAALADILNSSKKRGELPNITLANISFSDKSTEDDSLKEVFDRGDVKPYHILDRGGFRIGVFGLMGNDADKSAPYSVPVTFPNMVKTANKIVKTLRNEEKVDLVICLSHSGVEKLKNGEWGGEDVVLAKKVKGIDVIVSGHTHTELPEPIWVNNVPIVQTGDQGKNVGRLELNIENGKIASSAYKLIKVDDSIIGDISIQKEISERIEDINNELLKPLNLDYYTPIAETNYELLCNPNLSEEENNLGPLIADAIKYYIDTFSPSTTDITMVATGTIRDKIRVGKYGAQSVPDMFRVMSLGDGKDAIPGYPLAKVYITAKELKRIVELLLVAQKKHPAYYCYYGGLEVEYDDNKRILRKVKKMKIDGKEIDMSSKNKELYSVSASSYMLEFLSEINKMTYGLVKVYSKDKDGNRIKDNKETWIDFDSSKEGIQEGKEWMALVEYIKTFKDIDGNGIPNFSSRYKDAIIRVINVNNR